MRIYLYASARFWRSTEYGTSRQLNKSALAWNFSVVISQHYILLLRRPPKFEKSSKQSSRESTSDWMNTSLHKHKYFSNVLWRPTFIIYVILDRIWLRLFTICHCQVYKEIPKKRSSWIKLTDRWRYTLSTPLLFWRDKMMSVTANRHFTI